MLVQVNLLDAPAPVEDDLVYVPVQVDSSVVGIHQIEFTNSPQMVNQVHISVVSTLITA